MNSNIRKFACLIFALSVSAGASQSAFARSADSHKNSAADGRLIAAKTETFKQKEGFERPTKDIINTMKDNTVSGFSTMLDGLSQAYELDKTLKDAGPYTFFAVNDADFRKLPDDDKSTLWANKKKLKQVLSYHIVQGKWDEKKLIAAGKVKTVEGEDISVESKGGNLYVNNVLVKTADIPCTNGMMHVIDKVIMPPLSH